MYDGYKVATEYKRHLTDQRVFAEAKYDRWQVWWGDTGEESEIGHMDLYSAGENLP
jgi:hypothetical protein